MSRILLFIFIYKCISCYSDNLIKNPSFKSDFKKVIDKPLKKSNAFFPTNWNLLHEKSKINFFNSSTSTFHGFPIIKSLESDERIGFPMYREDNEIEGIQTQLVKPLKSGVKCEISIVIAQCHYSNYAINQIPFILSQNAVTSQDITSGENINVQIINIKKHMTYPQGWLKIRAIITAKGGEEYFTLINNRPRFAEPKLTASFTNCQNSQLLNNYFDNMGYYFIDAIEIIELSEKKYTGFCDYKTVSESNKDNQLTEKVEELKRKNILHPTSPTSFTKMKDYTHHIILFDVSGSMQADIGNTKFIFEQIYSSINEKDIITGIVFNSVSRTLFTRANKTDGLKKRVAEISSSGGTVLENGLLLVNNNIVADENTKLYLITDVGSSKVSKELTKYVSIKINKIDNSKSVLETYRTKCFEYDYVNNYTSYDNYNVSNVYDYSNVFRMHYLSKKEAKNIEKSIDTDNYSVTNIYNCQFQDTQSYVYDTLINYNPRNYVFLVDISKSMKDNDKIEQVRRALKTFTENMSHVDVVSLVTFDATPKLLAQNIPSYNADTINQLLKNIPPNGYTGAEKAIRFVYINYGGESKSHQSTTVVMFTDGIFKVTKSMVSSVYHNPHVHFKVYQFGGETNSELQKLESTKKIAYETTSKELLPKQLEKLKEEKHNLAIVYSDSKPFKKIIRFLK